jgi:hypothetical protein
MMTPEQAKHEREAVESAREQILASWTEWDSEAAQAAQTEQDHEAWLEVMRVHLGRVLNALVDEVAP